MTLLGNVVYTASQFGMLVAVARLTSTAEVGRYALALAITAPVFAFCGLKLRQVQVTDALGANRAGDFFGLRIVTSAVALATCIAIAVAAQLSIETITAVALFKAFEAQLDVFYGTLQRAGRLTAVAWSQILRAMLGLLVFAATVAWTESAAAAALALAAATLLVVVAVARDMRRNGTALRPRFHAGVLGPLARLALPLGASVALGSLLTNAPRYVIQSYEGASGVGVFAALAYFLVATGVVAQAIAEVASPRMADLFWTGKITNFVHLLRRLIVLGVALGCFGVIVALIAGRTLLRVIYGAEYAAEWQVLVLLMIAATVQYGTLFIGTAIDAMRLFRVQAPITAVGLAATVVGAYLLVPRFGLIGAAWSLAIAQLATTACLTWVYANSIRSHLSRQRQQEASAT